MDAQPGHCIAGVIRHWKNYKCRLFAPFLDHITNFEILDVATSTSIEPMLINAKVRWIRHVVYKEQIAFQKASCTKSFYAAEGIRASGTTKENVQRLRQS